MPQKVLQPSFSGGVFSPSLYSRVDLAKYSTGLRTAKNFYVHAHGGASNRQGTEFISKTLFQESQSRLVPFEFSLEQAYVLEAGDKYVGVLKDGGRSTASIDTLPERDFSKDISTYEYLKESAEWFPVLFVAAHGMSYVWIRPPYGWVSDGLTVTTETNSSDTLDATYNAGTNTLSIKLANATPSKNYANLIQAKVRAANAKFSNWLSFQSGYVFVNNPSVYSSASSSFPIGESVNYIFRATIPHAASSTNTMAMSDGNDFAIVEKADVVMVSPYLAADLPELKFAQSADVLYIAHPSYCPRMLVRYAEDNWAIETFTFTNGPFMPSNLTKTQTLTVSATTGTGKTLTAASALFDTSTPSKHIGSLWQLRHAVAGQRVTKAFTAAATSTSIRCGKTWRLVTGGTWTGSLDVEKSTDGGSTWTIIRGFSSTNDLNINTYGDVDAPCLIRATSPAFTSGTCTANLTSDAYEHTGIVKITAVASATSATCDVLTEVGATTAVWDWSEGSWSNYRGWPRAVTFHEDRLCFAGTNSEPQTTWTTKTGNYTDFGRSVPLVDSDGISVNLSARKMSGIKHLISLNGMAAMTSASEWSIGYDTNLTPTNTPQKCAGYNGCSDVAPIMVGERVLYFSPMGSMLKDMAFSLETNGFKSDDMTIMASHLFNGYSIVDMAYQQEPDKLLWCVRSDGKLLCMTYMREQEVFAWTEHNTDGEFESVCSIPGDGYNEVWFVVKRFINGAAVRYIERLVQRMDSTAPGDQMFVDCGKVIVNAVATTAVTGLTHLIGETVAVLADGDVVDGLVVSGTGTITLPTAATKVIVGLPYTCDLETLNVELNLNTGTTQGARVKISDVVVRFLNSRGGKLGPNADNLDTVQLNENIDVTLVEPLHTVDHQMTIPSGYDIGGRIFFRQSDPLPTTILAVIPNVTVGG